ncbi:MAG: type II toxin-antitoxin system HicA family toxin [Bacteroidales bacterium]|nr:type II toxin-antitoxin system HicA family toxin [Bacteroidales bacterium]
MSTKDKLIERFKTLPNDFTFDELVRVFSFFGFSLNNKGITSGSRVVFIKGSDSLMMHRPHPGNTVKKGPLKSAYKYLKKLKLL